MLDHIVGTLCVKILPSLVYDTLNMTDSPHPHSDRRPDTIDF
jgi:hypothetical protein